MFKRNVFKGNAADKANAAFNKEKKLLTLEDISERQIESIVEHMRRRYVMQTKSYYCCPDRKCRRMRSCAAAQGRCVCTGLPPMSRRADKRAKRDFRHNPPRRRRAT